MHRSDPPPEHVPVAIVGAGPVGLSTALALARFGVRSVVFERNASTSTRSKAPAIHARTREIFARWGVLERVMDEGTLLSRVDLHRMTGRPRVSIDFAELEGEVDRPGILFLEQGRTERALLDAVRDAGIAEVRFGSEVTELASRDGDEPAFGAGARLRVRHDGAESAVTADAVVGADGASSFVRRALDLPFDGLTYRVRPMLADVRVHDERDRLPWPRLHNDAGGITPAFRLQDGLWRIIRLEGSDPSKGDAVPDGEVRQRTNEVLGDGPPVEVVWASRFRIHLRSSSRFRVGRVALAGDAAHVHSPAGGLGMNAGIQDAADLGWKLAHALRGGDAEALLDAYDLERRAAAVERVSRYTDRLTRVFLLTPAPVREAAFAALRVLMRVPSVRARAIRRQAMIDIVYPPSPLLERNDRAAGVRLPNPVVVAADGTTTRLHRLLPDAPVLLDLTGAGSSHLDVEGIDVIRIGAGGWQDPGGSLARLAHPGGGWILVRPDGQVAWARPTGAELASACARALGYGDLAHYAATARRKRSTCASSLAGDGATGASVEKTPSSRR